MNMNVSIDAARHLQPLKTFSDKPDLTRMLNELNIEQFDLFCQTLRQRSILSANGRSFYKPWTDGEISFDRPVQRRDN